MAVTLSIITGRPKRDLIEMAFEFCGSAGYEFERTPEEVSAALRQLDLMMTEEPWVRTGYDLGAGLPEDPSGLADEDVPASYMHLALRLSPGLGASLSPTAAASITRSFNSVCSRYAVMPTALIAANTPRGSGHPRRVPFIQETR